MQGSERLVDGVGVGGGVAGGVQLPQAQVSLGLVTQRYGREEAVAGAGL
jgi:hypothetical protein